MRDADREPRLARRALPLGGEREVFWMVRTRDFAAKVALLVVTGLALAWVLRLATPPIGFGDAKHYLAMAENPGLLVSSPWGYRVAVPYLAAGLSAVFGASLPWTFLGLQFGLFATYWTVLILWLQHGLGVRARTAILVGLLFAVSGQGRYHLHNVIHVGLAEHLLLLLGTMAIFHRKFTALLVLVALSAPVKESIGMLLIPTFFVVEWFERPRSAAFWRAGLLVAVWLPLYLLIRSGVLFQGRAGFGTYASFYSWEYLQFVRDYYGGYLGAAVATVGTFGSLWLVAAAGLPRAPVRLAAQLTLVLLAILQVILATDVGRMVGSSVAVVLALAALALDRMPGWLQALVAAVTAAFLVTIGLGLPKPVTVGSMAVVGAVLLWQRRLFLARTTVPVPAGQAGA